MAWNRLFIWVEGPDDSLFFERVLKPRLKSVYDEVDIINYRNSTKAYCRRFIHSIKAMNADYIFLTDIDENPCITRKKEKILGTRPYLSDSDVIVVVKEIESWFLAGLCDDDACRLKVRTFKSTENVSKEIFDGFIPRKFDSRTDFMLELLKCFSFDDARTKNKSFDYFCCRCLNNSNE